MEDLLINTDKETGRNSPPINFANSIVINQSAFHVFPTGTDMISRPALSIELGNNALYKIALTTINYPINLSGVPSVANCPTLVFSHAPKEPQIVGCNTSYESFFTADYLNEDAVILSENLRLFNNQSPMAYLISRKQLWRVEEIFESMLEENATLRSFRNEMLQNLILEAILISQRLISVDVKFL